MAAGVYAPVAARLENGDNLERPSGKSVRLPYPGCKNRKETHTTGPGIRAQPRCEMGRDAGLCTAERLSSRLRLRRNTRSERGCARAKGRRHLEDGSSNGKAKSDHSLRRSCEHPVPKGRPRKRKTLVQSPA